jgi:biopolymer transport protein ExbD
MRRSRFRNNEAELDITSFMNLMIILVPVLLMSMVFSHISVLDLKLPDSASSSAPSDKPEDWVLELVLEDDQMIINLGPVAGTLFKRIPKIEDEESGELVHDFNALALILKETKRRLKEDKDLDKKDIVILSRPDTDYQTIVSAMDTVRSYKAVVVASVVDAELFPVISLGDAPIVGEGGAQ